MVYPAGAAEMTESCARRKGEIIFRIPEQHHHTQLPPYCQGYYYFFLVAVYYSIPYKDTDTQWTKMPTPIDRAINSRVSETINTNHIQLRLHISDLRLTYVPYISIERFLRYVPRETSSSYGAQSSRLKSLIHPMYDPNPQLSQESSPPQLHGRYGEGIGFLLIGMILLVVCISPAYPNFV